MTGSCSQIHPGPDPSPPGARLPLALPRAVQCTPDVESTAGWIQHAAKSHALTPSCPPASLPRAAQPSGASPAAATAALEDAYRKRVPHVEDCSKLPGGDSAYTHVPHNNGRDWTW